MECSLSNRFLAFFAYFFFIGSILFLISPISVASPLEFERLSVKDGLSHGIVYSILQDRQGYMWFGSQAGLNRYDGYNFQIYRADPLKPYSLSSHSIDRIMEDHTGLIWIATWGGGINIFDPWTEQFYHVRHDPSDSLSLSDDRIQSIFEDAEGNVWIGTYRGGMNKWVRQMRKFYDHPNHRESPLPDKLRFIRYQADFDDPHSVSENRIWSIKETSDGSIWVGTDDGLNRLDPDTGKFSHYRHDPADPNSPSHSRVRALYATHDDILWVGAQNGLSRFDPETETFTHYRYSPPSPSPLSDKTDKTGLKNNIITTIFEDSRGSLWIGSENDGLIHFDPDAEQFQIYLNNPYDSNSLSYNDIRSIYEDASGILWVGTRGGGINKLNLNPKGFRLITENPTLPVSLSHSRVTAVYHDSEYNRLWIGTDGGGLNLAQRDSDGQPVWITVYKNDSDDPSSLCDNRLRSIFRDSAGSLWIGSYSNGVSRIDPKTYQRIVSSDQPEGIKVEFHHIRHDLDSPVSLSDNRVWTIQENSDGYLWFCTDQGLDRFKLSGDPSTFSNGDYMSRADLPPKLSGKSTLCMTEDHTGTTWISIWGEGLNCLTDKGVTRYRRDARDSLSLSNDNVSVIYKDRNQSIWVGTSHGLNRIMQDNADNSVTFSQYFNETCSACNEIQAILEDDAGFLWISSQGGLSKFDPKNGTFRNYNINDGLQGDEFFQRASYQSENGEMFFGGIHGLSAFFPDQVKDNSHIPQIVITAFKKFDKTQKFDRALSYIDHIQLSYRDNYFAFEFAALDYVDPSKNRYAYKLEGFDKDWIYPDQRRYAGYTNLDGGKYLFRVKGSNNDGVWNETSISLHIVIDPPFWKTWWFYTLEILTAIGFVIGIVIFQQNRVRKDMENKQRAQELEKARNIQLSLIPSTPPELPDFSIAAYMETAKEVGGDYYDFIPVAEKDKMYITIGDVSGKGVPASLLMVVVRTIFHTLAAENLSTLDILVRTNQRIYPDLSKMKNPMFITLLLFAWDKKNKVLSYTAAGHERILIFRQARGECEVIKSGGVCLGIVDTIEYVLEEKELTLETGDVMLIYTDGVTEYINTDQEMFGLNRLVSYVGKIGDLSPDKIVDRLLKQLQEFGGGASQMDDVTLVVMKKM